jgi:uncharacterized protein YbgA (DUF1722 family)/uncharacterized protein YbbK (DUF523 family)
MLRPRIGLSRCFLENVRYNGGIIKDDFVEKLKSYVDFVKFCPEIDIGLGVPRPRIVIKEINNEKRLIQPETGEDLTEIMNKYVEEVIKNLKEIDGFILKSKSPSCGIGSAKIYKNDKILKTDGFFAGAIRKAFPYLPVEDENRLKNKEIKRHFLTRIFAFSELRNLIKNPSIKELIEFHTKYKYLLLTYNQKNLKELGKIVANGKMNLEQKLSNYKKIFYQSFLKKPSNKKHFNTLMHIFGHISKELTKEERKYLLNSIEKYKKGLIELESIFELFKYLSVRFKNQYLLIQKYFFPYPEELDK